MTKLNKMGTVVSLPLVRIDYNGTPLMRTIQIYVRTVGAVRVLCILNIIYNTGQTDSVYTTKPNTGRSVRLTACKQKARHKPKI